MRRQPSILLVAPRSSLPNVSNTALPALQAQLLNSADNAPTDSRVGSVPGSSTPPLHAPPPPLPGSFPLAPQILHAPSVRHTLSSSRSTPPPPAASLLPSTSAASLSTPLHPLPPSLPTSAPNVPTPALCF